MSGVSPERCFILCDEAIIAYVGTPLHLISVQVNTFVLIMPACIAGLRARRSRIANARQQMLNAVLQYEKQSIRHIVPDKDSGIALENSPVWDRIRKTVAKHGCDPACTGTPERMQFYERAKNAFVTVRTGETQS